MALAATGLWWWLADGRAPVADPALVTVEVVRPAVLTAQAQAGDAAYHRHCAACHGPDGAGQRGIAPPLVHPIYEPDHHGDGAFHAAVRFGVIAHHWPYGDMPAQPHVTEAEVEAIIAFVRALQRANGIE